MILHEIGALEVLQILIDIGEVRERPPVILMTDGTTLRFMFHNSLLMMPVEGTA